MCKSKKPWDLICALEFLKEYLQRMYDGIHTKYHCQDVHCMQGVVDALEKYQGKVCKWKSQEIHRTRYTYSKLTFEEGDIFDAIKDSRAKWEYCPYCGGKIIEVDESGKEIV